MNCRTHTEKPAVTTCVQCATGMCPECMEAGISLDSKAMCAHCAPDALRSAIAQLKSQCWRNKLKFALSGGIIGIGLVLAVGQLLGNEPGKGTHAFLIILLFFGFAGVLSVMRRENVNVAGHGFLLASGRADASLMSGCVSLLVALVLGIVVAPLNMYRYFTSFRNSEKTIMEYEQLLAKYQSQ